ncbi:patatin-like phospholipase family protein [Klebsiella quasipneumoniae subsp. similipneumoniae]|nr:patatin-like phospholipase family protein [Klebsiella quasipneumoniae subsp. similipneumoniae]
MATTPYGWKLRCTSIDKPSQLEGKQSLDELDVNHDYLCLITADLATEYKVELPVMAELYWEKANDVNPAVFCRCSMSIPFVFQPYTVKIPHMDNNLQLKWQKYTGISFQSRLATRFPPPIACFVDGGIMSNFPIDVFHNPTKVPARPTFGVKLQLDDHSHEINSTLDIFAQSFNTARHAMNYDFIKKNPDYNKLVSFIDTGDIGWLDFSMCDANKLKLFRLGAETAYQFLINFDWHNYKKIRRDITSAYQTSLPLAKLNRYFKNK